MRNTDLAGNARRPAIVFGLLLASALAFAGCSGSDNPSGADDGGRQFTTKSETVGSVDVSATPTSISADGANFAVTLDTHSGDLSLDLIRASSLSVAGNDWPVAKVSGDGPGGHHREVTIRFAARGPRTGEMRLTIIGFDRPASFTWKLPAAVTTSDR